MGVQHCIITLDNQWNTYYPGQTVNGTAVFNLDKPKKIRGIFIKFKGVAEVKWSTSESVRDNNTGKTNDITVDHTNSEEYFTITYYLLGSKNASDIELPQGTHTYPFTCALPPTLPSSFEGQHGFVRYTVKVTLDRPWKFDEETKMAFTVTSHLDLNSSPEYRNPIHFQMEKTFCCCWCKSGPLTLDVRLPVSGYCCGQTIPLDVNCENTSGVRVDDIVIKLNKLITYRAKFPTNETKNDEICISKIKLGSVDGQEAKNLQELLEIPPLPPSNLVNCSIIDLMYNVEVVCNVSGFHMDMEDTKVITLGTVPLVGFQPPPPKGQQNDMLPSVPVSNITSSETPLLACKPNVAYPAQQYPVPYPQTNIHPNNPQTAPYPIQNSPNVYPIDPSGKVSPSAPMMENQPSGYPGMGQPTFKECQFSASNIQDSSDNQHMQVSGNQVFAPRYPTYGFVIQ